MLTKFKEGIRSLSFGSRIGIILILFGIIPLLVTQQMMMRLYEKHIIKDTCNSALSVVEANDKTINTMLSGIEKTSQLMINSQFFYDIFSKFDEMSVSDLMRNDRIITNEVAKQFSAQMEVFESYLFTSQWLFGKGGHISSSTVDSVKQAGWDEIAHQYSGVPYWITGYDYGESVQSEYLVNKDQYDYKYLFTMIREMNFLYSYMGSYQRLSEDIEKPILVVHVKESSIRDVYKDSISYEGSLYTIVNENGIVCSSDNELFQIGNSVPEDIFRYHGSTGFVTYTLNNEEYLLCYDTFKEEKLLSFVLVSMDVLMEDTIAQTRKLQSIFIFLLIFLSAVVAFLLARTITKPIYALINASKRVAGGDFSANTPIPKDRDFKVLTESFNHMETEISRLIYENYEISLREKETQLMALSMQINPHFLYNTLNTISMLSIKNGDEETSELIISLSEMLQYTFRNQNEKGPLGDEIAWISNYLFIMSKRFNGVFQTRMDIDESLMDCRIPKFILQPIMENAVLHGFKNMKSGGMLELNITRQGKYITFVIKDNGIGMEADNLERYIEAWTVDGHVGMSNVHRRLHLLYGEEYKIDILSQINKGTRISIQIPYEE
ncbi:sensor histidine kinase [Lachnospiraceae bacterium OttesenSCG-928-D06]|nr:sensor histidine kinase [Lachnospiraceae bacterium OttesenSCG-928-D06]